MEGWVDDPLNELHRLEIVWRCFEIRVHSTWNIHELTSFCVHIFNLMQLSSTIPCVAHKVDTSKCTSTRWHTLMTEWNKYNFVCALHSSCKRCVLSGFWNIILCTNSHNALMISFCNANTLQLHTSFFRFDYTWIFAKMDYLTLLHPISLAQNSISLWTCRATPRISDCVYVRGWTRYKFN